MKSDFEKILALVDRPIQELAKKAKALVQEIMPDVVEVPWIKQKIIGYGVGPKKMSEHFCYIGLFKQHINLGFYYGADLPDPQKMLQGTGALFRHIKISRPEQLEDPGLRQLLVSASKYLPKLNSK